MNHINRRNFIKKGAMGGAGIMMVPEMLSASFNSFMGTAGGHPLMNGLTPISVIDNACILASGCGEISQVSQNVLFADPHFSGKAIGNKARLAVALPAFHDSHIELIQIVKDNYEGLRGTGHLQGKHALAFGWAGVNAVEKYINSAIGEKDGDQAAGVRMHQDAVVIRGFSGDSDPGKASREDMEALLNAMLTRTVTRTHTLKPDSDDGIGWVNRMSEWRRKNVENMSRFADTIVHPEESKAGKQFFSKEDLIVDVAIRLQHSEFVSTEEVLNCINSGGYKSHYARALASAAQGIIAIDRYLNREISRTRMREILGV